MNFASSGVTFAIFFRDLDFKNDNSKEGERLQEIVSQWQVLTIYIWWVRIGLE